MKFLWALISDPLFVWSAIAFVALYFGFLRRRKAVYGKDGIVFDPETRTYRIYDVGLYFQDPVRREGAKGVLLPEKKE